MTSTLQISEDLERQRAQMENDKRDAEIEAGTLEFLSDPANLKEVLDELNNDEDYLKRQALLFGRHSAGSEGLEHWQRVREEAYAYMKRHYTGVFTG